MATCFLLTEGTRLTKMEAAGQHEDRTMEVLADCPEKLGWLPSGSSATAVLFMRQRGSMCRKRVRGTPNSKRKAEEARERTFLQREGIRRATGDHVKAEEVLNNSVGCLGTLVKDTAGATHALTCGAKLDTSKMRWR